MPIPQTNPGYTSVRSVTPRQVLVQASKDRAIKIPVLLDGTHSYDFGAGTGYEKYIRGGALLAWSSTQSKWAPCKRTKASAAGSATATLAVDSAIHFRAGDSVIVGANAAQAIVSVDSATQITLTSAITWEDNAPVYVAQWATASAILLNDEVVLRNYDNTSNQDQQAIAVIAGHINQDMVLGDCMAICEDPASSRYLKNLIFDDYQDQTDTLPFPFLPLGFDFARAVGGNYTVTAADNGTLFVASAAATFTLPTKAAGLRFGFYQKADANLSVASAGSADDIIIFNDAAADSMTYSTAGEKIGAFCAVACAPDASKWLGFHLCKNTLTVA